jgi:hypothetical protein
MTSRNDARPRKHDPGYSQHLLMAAYTRLMQLPRRVDDNGSILVITIASWELHLIELPLSGRADKRSLWVELFDLTSARNIDSRGCHDLAEAAATVEYSLAFAQQWLAGRA